MSRLLCTALVCCMLLLSCAKPPESLETEELFTALVVRAGPFLETDETISKAFVLQVSERSKGFLRQGQEVIVL